MFTQLEPTGRRFPTRTVVILSLCATLNSYTLVNLFPYVGLMVKELLALETTNELGFYAGYVASAFTLGRFVSCYALGYITDSVGRKPVIVGGLLSITVCSLAFGLSPTFGFAIASRLVLGLTNGMAPALRTAMREACGQEHVLQGMTYIAGGKSISLVLGTGIGGLLAQPAVNYPSLFSGDGLFGKYPFLLPNLVGAVVALLLLPIVVLFVPETKHFDEQRAVENGPIRCDDIEVAEPIQQSTASSGLDTLEDYPGGSKVTDTINGHRDGEAYARVDKEEPGARAPGRLLAVPHVKMVLFLACVVQALLIGFEEAYPLWALSTPDVGGLGWNSVDIGKVFLAAGVIVAVLQLVLFPPVIKVLGLTVWQRTGCLLAIPAFIAVPCSRSISWNDGSLFFVSVAGTSLVYCCMAMVNLALATSSTTLVRAAMRGKLAGLFNMAENLGRFSGPIGFATTFAWSVSSSSPDWIGHPFVFLFAAFSMSVVAVLAWGAITHKNMTPPEEK